MEFVQGIAAVSRLINSLNENQKREFDQIFKTFGKQMALRKFGANPEMAHIIGNSDSFEAVIQGVLLSKTAMEELRGDANQHKDGANECREAIIKCPNCDFIHIKEI